MKKTDVALCIDIGGTNLRYGLVSEKGNCIHFNKTAIEKQDKTESGVIHKILVILSSLQKECNAKIKGLGIAIPGFIDFEKEIVTSSPNFPEWKNFSVKKILEEKICLPVVIENDANAFAIGESWKGVGKGFKNFIGITLGTGVGGGVILNGQIWHGIDGSAGEIGHITLYPDGLQCNCGNRGCLEMYASAQAVAREGIDLLKEKGLKATDRDIALEIFKLANRGNREAIKIFNIIGYYLGVAISDIANILNIDGVVIGGGLSNAWEFIYPAIQKEISYRTNPVSRKGLKILKSKLGDSAAILGMARVVF